MNRYKLIEYILNAVTIIAPTLLMVLNTCISADCVLGQGVITGVSTFAAAVKSFSKLHEKRINYRKAAEDIKNETTLYVHWVGEYSEYDRKEIFLANIGEIIKEEHAGWVKIEADTEWHK